MTKIELQSNEILVLRNCHADGSSYNGFVWPKSGYVECPDWQDDDNCGHGLHGLPWGVGSTSYFYDDADAAWIVFVTSTSAGQYRHGAGDLTDKCKARSANVIYFGDKLGAIQLLAAHLPTGLPMNFATQTAGDRSTQKAGDDSTQTAGDRSMQTAGDDSTQKAGYRSVQVVFWWRGGEWCSACRVVPDRHVNKWCKIKNGEWEECSESEAAEAEQRVSLEVVS